MAQTNLILCDTNVIIDILRNKQSIIDEINSIGMENIIISTITMAELLYGAINKTEFEKIKKHTEFIRILPINESISDIFMEIVSKYALSHSIGIPDAIIAATAIFYNIELYTLNLKDFNFIPNLKLFKKKP
jgi:tRNA(fMet)-specific endonuclease VapC